MSSPTPMPRHRYREGSGQSCDDKRVLDRDLVPGAFGCCHFKDAEGVTVPYGLGDAS